MAAWLRRTGSTRRPRGQLAEPDQHQVNGHWEKAAQLWTDLGCPYEAALARLDAAEEGALREALSAFTELGASAMARLTRQKLRALGARSIPVGPRSATRDDPLGLTRREREVLEEICAGRSNSSRHGSDFRHFGTTRTRSFGMDAAFMLFQRRGRGIHVVSAEPDWAADRDHWSQEFSGSPKAPGIAAGPVAARAGRRI